MATQWDYEELLLLAKKHGLKTGTFEGMSFEFFAPTIEPVAKLEKTDDKPKQPPRKNLLDAALDAELE